MSLKEKQERLEAKFANKNYILVKFVRKISEQKEVKEVDDIGIIDLDTALDWRSVVNELVINDGYSVIGGNFPSAEHTVKVAEAKKYVESYTKGLPKVEPKPAEVKTEAKAKEVNKRLKKGDE